MPDYLSHRQNAVVTDPQNIAALNSCLETLADQFGLAWLEQPGNNPVQELWQAKHAMATNELLNLGDAIGNLLQADGRWTKRQIELMKSSDAGQRAGATFEILGLSLFNGPGQKVIPARDDQKGYDGTVVLQDGCLMVSIKNHGVSTHETDFLKRSGEIHGEFLDCMARSRANAMDVRIMALKQPTTADWSTLRGQIADVVAGNKPADSAAWQGFRRLLDPRWQPSPWHASYAFLLLAPFHPNEQKKFEDKIGEGIANLERHCSQVPPDVCRTLFLRLSASASIPDCAQWAREYFDQYPNTNVEVIVLYQAALAVDMAKDTTQITHHFVPVFGTKYAAWRDGGTAPRGFSINSLVGKIEMNATRLVMSNGVTTMPMPAGYMFQRSEINRYYDPQKGQHDAVISNPAPGVFINAVSGPGPALMMRASTDSRLLLLP